MKGLSEAAGDRVSLLWGTAGLGLASHGLGLDSEVAASWLCDFWMLLSLSGLCFSCV